MFFISVYHMIDFIIWYDGAYYLYNLHEFTKKQ